MRKLYGSTSWRRVLALVLVFVMMFSVMGTSGYSVFAEGLEETGEAVVEPAAEEPAQEEEFTLQGESPGEEEAEAVVEAEEGEVEVEAVEEAEEEAEEPAEEAVEESAEDEESEEPAEAVEEETAESEELEAEPAEEAEEEAEEPAKEPAEEEGEEEETLIAEAAQIIEGDDGAEAPAEEEVAEAVEEAIEELPEEVLPEGTTSFEPVKFDDAIVMITADPYTFPDDTTVVVEEVPIGRTVLKAIDGVVDAVPIKAYDITFFDASGTDIQPAKPVKISIESIDLPEVDNLQILHIDDNGRKADIVEGVEETESGFEFDAAHFSIYVIMDGENQTFRRTYKFEDINANGEYAAYEFYNKAGEKVDNQILKDGDELEPVGEPYHTGFDFEGWYLWDDETAIWGSEVSFETPISMNLAEDETVTVRAKYNNVFYLYFHETENGSSPDIVLTTCVIPEGGSYAISSIVAPIPDAGYLFVGWAEGNSASILNSPYTPNKSVHLYPIFNEGYWLRFDGNGVGASYTDAICKLSSESLSPNDKPEPPTRPGYEFDDWYTNATGGEVFDWSGKLEGDTTVFAHWIPDDAKYSVFYWLENADDSKYSFLTSKSLSGTSDSPTEAAALTATDMAQFTNIDWNGFVMKEIEQAVINGDGSTVVNVFYDRKTVTLTFHRDGNVSYTPDQEGEYYKVSISSGNPQDYYYKTGSGQYDYSRFDSVTRESQYFHYSDEGPLAYIEGDTIPLYERHIIWILFVPVDVEYVQSNSVYGTITRYSISGDPDIVVSAKYGEDIHDRWPENPDGSTSWYLDDDTYVGMITTMPVSDTEYFYRAPNGSLNLAIDFKLQDLNNPKHFTTYTIATAKGRSGNYTTADDYSGIDGFSINAASEADANTISHTNGGDPNATYDEAYSRSPKIGTTFSQGTHTYQPETYTLTFYYLRNKYDIKFVSGSETIKTETGIFYEADISKKKPAQFVEGKTTKEINGKTYIFEGWFDNKSCDGAAYEFTTMPAGNVVLYAKWEPAWHIVTIDPNGGELNSTQSTWFWVEDGELVTEYHPTRDYVTIQGNAEDGDTVYYYHKRINYDDADSSLRRAYYTTDGSLSTDGQTYVKESGAYVLEGWYELKDNGELEDTPYVFATPVRSDITLQAQWRKTGAYTVAYQGVVDGIGGNAPTDNASYADKAVITVPGAPSGITAMYIFDGWTVVDASGTAVDNKIYKPGDELTLNAEWADSNKVIHIQAHYTKVDESSDPVGITKLVLNANGGVTSITNGTFKDENGKLSPVTVVDNVVTYSNLPLNQKFALADVNDKFTKEGYKLKGWNHEKAAADAGAVEYGVDKVYTLGVDNEDPADNTLYAVWVKAYNVTYKYSGDVPDNPPTLPAEVSYEEGETVAIADTPDAVEGYTFKGWTITSPEGTTVSANGEFDMPADDVIITGEWEENAPPVVDTYTVEYLPGDHGAFTAGVTGKTTFSSLSAGEDTPVFDGEVDSKGNPAGAENYCFDGWDPEWKPTVLAEYCAPNTLVITYTAKWADDKNQNDIDDKLDEFKVVYDLDGGTTTNEATTFTGLKVGDATPKIADPTKEGYTFKEWQPTVADTVKAEDAKDSADKLTITYKAIYAQNEQPPVEPETITIEYHANYKDADDVVVSEDSELPATIKHPSNVQKDGVPFSANNGQWVNTATGKTWKFIGWYTEKDQNTEGGTWYKNPPVTYTVTTNDDQGNQQSDPGTTNSVVGSSARSVRAMIATSSEGDTADLILWAQWEEVTQDNPGGGGGNNPTPRDPDPTPNPDPDPIVDPDEPIDDGDTPLAPGTIDDEDETIDDGDTPLAPAEVEEDTEIDEEPTPLSPFTGDERHTAVWGFVSLLSLAGIVVVARKRREE